VAVFQNRLDGQGGLEKYGAYLIETLSRDLQVDVVVQHDVDLARVERAFGVRLDRARFVNDPRCVPDFSPGSGWKARVQRWSGARDFYQLTSQYDLIVAQTVGLPFRSGAGRSMLLCHFPVVREDRVDRSASSSLRSLLSSHGRSQRAIRSRLSSWERIICNSEFTRHWIDQYWARDADVVNPPIALPDDVSLGPRKNWIVGVGFFSRPAAGEPWSYKRQELLIDTFKQLCDAGLKGWELHLAGHVLPPTPEAHAYVGELRARADNYPVTLHPDCSHAELLDLYRQSSIFWHATGYGVDEEREPEKMEHFGMVTAESMGWGCVPVVVNKGGQPEIVEHGRSGYLWSTLDEFKALTMQLTGEPNALAAVREAAVKRAHHFGIDRFRRQVDGLVRDELARLEKPRR
jgi:glycosyltransferase involved in cell wall biosynthesis